MNTNALLVVVQYVSIRWSPDKVKPKVNLSLFWGLFLFHLAETAPNLVPDSVTIPIRGSVCFEVTEPDPTTSIVVIVLYVLPCSFDIIMRYNELSVCYYKTFANEPNERKKV